MHSPETRGLIRFLYTQNPFYLLSTALILYGLQAAFASAESLSEPVRAWGLAGALFGYATLMAVTGCLIVRLGGVWQDARSIVLILLLLFVAISTSFDQICNTFPSTATGVLLAGLGFTACITEVVLRVLKIYFPWPYRLPYYALVSSFFLYPLWTSTVITGATDDTVAWRLFLYPTLCGLISLSLIPAIRKSSRLVKDNGTPWHWPWFPWTVFVFLAAGVCGRAWALSLSFMPLEGWKTPFGIYFLTPLAASICVLLLEISVIERLPRLALGVLCSAPVLVLLSTAPLGGEWYERFLASLTGSLGSPLWLSTLMLGAFYVYAWSRRQRGAELGIVLSLLIATFIHPQSRTVADAGQLQYWPFLVLGAWQFAAGLARNHSLRAFGGTLCLVAGVTLGLQRTWFVMLSGVLPYHLALIAVLGVSCYFRDPAAKAIRGMAACWLIASGSYTVLALPNQIPFWLGSLYTVLLACVAVGIWYRFREPIWLIAVLGNLGAVSLAHAVVSWTLVYRQFGPRAALALAVGLICFIIATSISALKGGIRPAMQRYLVGIRKALAS
jgi:hypothetical protein